MVRNYKRKTERTLISEESLKLAIQDVLVNKRSVRAAANRFNVNKSTLYFRIKRKVRGSIRNFNNDSGNEDSEAVIVDDAVDNDQTVSKYASRKVFTPAEEIELREYLLKSSNIHYGLTYRTTRKLAFEFAVQRKKQFPKSWSDNGLAGEDWMLGYMKRHKTLTLRKPENTSLQRATAFNRENINQFFDNYAKVLSNFHFSPDRILNMDESGITTVLQAPKVIAPMGKKQVGQIVSGERGSLVTFCGIISATGVSLPPVYIFPRKKTRELMFGAVPGAIALSSGNAWITAELFIQILKHIQKHTQSSKENPLLLLVDNHESHTSLAAITYCRDNGITMLSFPPHCTHRMQPLDVGLYGPFKSRCKVAFNDYLASSGGITIKVSDIAKLTASPYLQTFTPCNIIKSFETTGLYPINRFVFKEVADYESIPSSSTVTNLNTNTVADDPIQEPSTSKVTDSEPDSRIIVADILKHILQEIFKTSKPRIKLTDIRPFQIIRKKRPTARSRRSTIYTSTPEKEKLKVKAQEKERKTVNKATKIRVKRDIANEIDMERPISEKKGKSSKFKTNAEETGQASYEKIESDRKHVNKKRQRISLSSSEEEDPKEIKLKDYSSDSVFDMSPDEDEGMLWLLDSDKISTDDYLLVRFPTKKTVRHYIGHVLGVQEGDAYEMKFMRKKGTFGFVYPQAEDVSLVYRTDVVAKLPTPKMLGGTSRLTSCFRFDVNFEGYNIE